MGLCVEFFTCCSVCMRRPYYHQPYFNKSHGSRRSYQTSSKNPGGIRNNPVKWIGQALGPPSLHELNVKLLSRVHFLVGGNQRDLARCM